jgi:ribosome-associated heat shock protein Hsp15
VSDSQRIDQWLWRARFFKSRAQAARLCTRRRVRVDGAVIAKAHYAVRPGHVLTFPQGLAIRAVRILALGGRRGPAGEAAGLYEDLLGPAEAAAPADTVDKHP